MSIPSVAVQFGVRAGESILAAALRQQIHLPWGCGSGVCGVCMVQVLGGRLRYPAGAPLALFEADAQAGKALVCCAHPCSDVRLAVPELEQPLRR